MLGFSLPKLIVLAIIIAAVWYGFKMVSRRNKLRADEALSREKEAVEDMSRCAVCDTFVPGGARHCGRSGCPYPN
jgi:hypothetical protein